MKKRVFLLVTIIICIAVILCGCEKDIVSKEAINTRFTAAHSEVVTDYQHKYSWWQGDFVLVPNVHTVTYPDKYEVEYIVTYADGTTSTVWEEVTEAEYKAIVDGLEESK